MTIGGFSFKLLMLTGRCVSFPEIIGHFLIATSKLDNNRSHVCLVASALLEKISNEFK